MIDQAKGQEFLRELPEIRQDLPFSPSLLGQLFSMTSESSLTPLDNVAIAINQDQGLSTKVLTLANSAFYGLQARVTSVARAVALLGLKEIRNLLLLLGTQALTVRHAYPKDFDIRLYWDHQLAVASCAKMLASHKPELDEDVLFTAGLLHDLGMLLTALYRPQDWQAIHDDVQTNSFTWSQAEERHWGLEHGLIGAMTLNSWNLPHELTEPVNWHHAPHLAEERQEEARIICAADALHHRLLDPEYVFSPIAVESMDALDIDSEEALKQLAEGLDDESVSQLVAQLT